MIIIFARKLTDQKENVDKNIFDKSGNFFFIMPVCWLDLSLRLTLATTTALMLRYVIPFFYFC